MAIRVQRTPMRASTFRGLQIGIWVSGAVAGAGTALVFGNLALLLVAPMVWFILFSSIQLWYAEPALDEWDKVPAKVRMEMVRVGHPAAFTLAQYDRDPDVRRLWQKTLRVGKRASD